MNNNQSDNLFTCFAACCLSHTDWMHTHKNKGDGHYEPAADTEQIQDRCMLGDSITPSVLSLSFRQFWFWPQHSSLSSIIWFVSEPMESNCFNISSSG